MGGENQETTGIIYINVDILHNYISFITYMYIQSFSETGIGRYQTFINGKLWADYPMKTMNTGYRSIDEYILQDS